MQRSVASLLSLACLAAIACGKDNAGNPVAPRPTNIQAARAASAGEASDNQVERGDTDSPFTLAVIGDTPYGPIKLAEFPSLIAKINNDPAVLMVAHLGDIKAGKNSDCSNAYFMNIRSLFDTFEDPLVYTPGDNEWTDCHQAIKNNGTYTPTERLAKVRELFFPVAGQTLGISSTHVESEALDPANSAYIENVLFKRSHVVFAALNITGSNNDLAAWGIPLGPDAANYPTQAEEFAARAQANSAWLSRTFSTAEKTHAAGVVLFFQADMWDTSEPTLSGFDALVQQIGNLAVDFGKPVLLLEGDSHKFRVDNPYSVASSLHTVHASTPVADNITRVVVEGSDAGRTEYLRLTIDPSRKGTLFSWERVPLN
jgi:hypothetical protein